MLDPFAWRQQNTRRTLTRGGVIAYPTEGVWGLGCLPASLSAVTRILAIKNRSWEQGLILVASSVEQFLPYLEGLPEECRTTLESPSPGPVTYLVPDNGYCPLWIKGKHPTVALRVSTHPVVRSICQGVDSPIVSTSANPSGRPPAKTILQVRRYFPRSIDFFVPGKLGSARGASEVRNLLTNEVVRAASG